MKPFYVLYSTPGEAKPRLELVWARNRAAAENYIRALRGRDVTIFCAAIAKKYATR